MFLVDADPIVYMAGFAAEDAVYEVVYETQDGSLVHTYVESDMREWKKLAHDSGWHIHSQDKLVRPKPLEIALTITRSVMDALLEEARAADLWPMVVLLSGPGNFRTEIAKARPYKGNRKEDAKPHWYGQIRNYLQEVWGARVIEGHEADDEIAILAQTSERYAVVSLDKDLDQIPGKHYDYKRKVWYEISPQEAMELFYAQVLSGDSTDNIPGLAGIGQKKAEGMVRSWVREWEDAPDLGNPKVSLEEYLWLSVIHAYENGSVLDQDGNTITDRHPHDLALEMARLVRLRRTYGEIWAPPGEEFDE